MRSKLKEPKQEGMSQVKTGEKGLQGRGSGWCEAKEERVLA